MSQDVHADSYRAAFNAANADLDEILKRFEWLRLRKERLENVVAVLGPFLSQERAVSVPARQAMDAPPAPAQEAEVATAGPAEPAPSEQVEYATQYEFQKVANELTTRFRPVSTSWSDLVSRPAKLVMG
jgi:hypothetical protein